jgi:(2R)-sulfolactate sulfo-lyase subunit beta
LAIDLNNKTFWGYRRQNGRAGVRNHVIVLPVDDLSNAACEAVANNIRGAMAIPHPYGRLQFGADLDLHFRTLIGTGCNPNVAAVIVIGIEDQWAKKVADGIAATGKPVQYFGIELHGDHDTIMRASKMAKCFVQEASALVREECPIQDLWVSTKCGESDTTSGCAGNPSVGNAYDKFYEQGMTLIFGETTEITGGEHLVAARCRTPEIREQFMAMFNRYQDVVNRHKTSDLSESQPTKGNIAGGLTTIEEKALGNIQKIGKKCLVDGVLDKAEVPTGPGLWFMDSSSAAAEMVTLCRRVGVRGPSVPDRPVQRDRQPDSTCGEDLRQSAHGAHHEGTHRRRRERAAASRNQCGPGRGYGSGYDPADCQRTAHQRRGVGAQGIRADPVVRERVELYLSPAA